MGRDNVYIRSIIASGREHPSGCVQDGLQGAREEPGLGGGSGEDTYATIQVRDPGGLTQGTPKGLRSTRL